LTPVAVTIPIGNFDCRFSKLEGGFRERETLLHTAKNRNDALVVVLSFMFVAGMAVALVLFLLWRNHPAAMAQGLEYHAAVMVCPPFILVDAIGSAGDSTLALVLTGGTIVFANGALYAGLAAFVYWAVVTFWPRRGM
jgi:hypothetical protein